MLLTTSKKIHNVELFIGNYSRCISIGTNRETEPKMSSYGFTSSIAVNWFLINWSVACKCIKTTKTATFSTTCRKPRKKIEIRVRYGNAESGDVLLGTSLTRFMNKEIQNNTGTMVETLEICVASYGKLTEVENLLLSVTKKNIY